METHVKWPQGYTTFYRQVRAAAPQILTGTLLAIDPGSVCAGYAVFVAGVLVKSGTIKLPSAVIYDRLKYLYRAIGEIVENPTVTVIEEIRGQNFSHRFLIYSIGVSIAATSAPITIELPLNVWKALAKATPEYKKTDENDGIMIGASLIRLARELQIKED